MTEGNKQASSNVTGMGSGGANLSDLYVTTAWFISPQRPGFAVTFCQGASKQYQ